MLLRRNLLLSYSVNENVLITYYMPGTIISAGDISAKRTRQIKSTVLMNLIVYA